MADFLAAQKDTLIHEGKLCDVPGDAGGRTYCGISYKNFPNWAGWKIIDEHFLKNGEGLAELAPLVNQFYKANFWDKVKGDFIVDQATAASIYDFAVNAGVNQSVRLAQAALNVPDTGIMDYDTLTALNNTNGFAL